MIIYTRNGDLAFKEFTFPDGQPHFTLQTKNDAGSVTIEAAIRNPNELFQVELAGTVLKQNYARVHLDIRYLMAARMDRNIDGMQPHTLFVVAGMLRSFRPIFKRIRILDPHSDTAVKIFSEAGVDVRAVLPYEVVSQVLATLGGDTVVVIPDKGAINRSRLLGKGAAGFAQMFKERDPQTGHIIGMTLEDPVANKRCLIVDDICDGGATFVRAAEILKEAGASEVNLYVTHGIFSKKLPLPGIKNIFVTDSYHNWAAVPHCSLICIPISMRNL